MHICAYTYIYKIPGSWCNACILEIVTAIYMHIHAYTYSWRIFSQSMYIFSQSRTSRRLMPCMYTRNSNIYADTSVYIHISTPDVYIFRVRKSLIYMVKYWIYVHICAVWKMVIFYVFPKKCMCFSCILTYMYVYDSAFCMYFVCIHVFCIYITVSMRLTTFCTENTLIYAYTFIYIQYTTGIHTVYNTIYCNIQTKLMSRYMYVYVCIHTRICQ